MNTPGKKFDGAVKKKPLSWDDLYTLSTLAQARSYVAAAAALKLTRATVVRRMQRLELALGEQLLEEHQGAIALTARGEQVLATARQMGELAEGLACAPAGAAAGRHAATVSGKVRLTAPEGIAVHLLAPALGGLLRTHPQLRVDLLADAAVLSISHKQADIAVRLHYPDDGNLVALAAPPLAYALYRARGSEAQALIGYDGSGARFPESAALRRHCPGQETAVRSNSLAAQLQAVRSGAGIALLPCYLAAAHAELEALSGVLLEKPVYIVYHGKDRDTPRIQATAAWLRQQLAPLATASAVAAQGILAG